MTEYRPEQHEEQHPPPTTEQIARAAEPSPQPPRRLGRCRRSSR
jgi:hypothetical protein